MTKRSTVKAPEVRTADGIEYSLIRSARRTMALQVDECGAVTVRAPLQMPELQADSFVVCKQNWIRKKQEAVRESMFFRDLVLRDGASVPYLGARIMLRVCDVPVPILWRGLLLLPKKGDIERQFRLWRKQQAALLLEGRVRFYSYKTGLYPDSLRIGEAQTGWGSMSRKRKMMLNAALIHYPQRVADYVIVHELCHIRHMDHSPAFYAAVEQWIPEAKQIQKEMRRVGIPIIRSEEAAQP